MATSAGATRPADQITFAHNSERQFARLLDFYRVEWEYEPTAFPIEWDAAGRPSQMFRPDFYLPGFDLYIEITTLNQRLVTKKNRKVRRLRELYPDVRIKVLYQKDYLSLLAKYGLEPPSQLAGVVGAGVLAAGVAEERTWAPAAEDPAGRARAATPREPTAGSGSTEGPEVPGVTKRSGPGERSSPAERAGSGDRAGAAERAGAAGRPRVVPDPPLAPPPLPADPELVRLAQVPLPAEAARRRRSSAARRAG
jgi:hypothetical protein